MLPLDLQFTKLRKHRLKMVIWPFLKYRLCYRCHVQLLAARSCGGNTKDKFTDFSSKSTQQSVVLLLHSTVCVRNAIVILHSSSAVCVVRLSIVCCFVVVAADVTLFMLLLCCCCCYGCIVFVTFGHYLHALGQCQRTGVAVVVAVDLDVHGAVHVAVHDGCCC